MQLLPSTLYKVKTVIELEQLTINKYGIPGYTLMRRAGQAIQNLISEKFSLDKTILVLCGAGNNAGDGYVIARLAKQSGYTVKLLSLIDGESLKGDALQAYKHWLECGDVESAGFDELNVDSKTRSCIEQADIIIDALLGTGLTREVSGQWKIIIDTVNQCRLHQSRGSQSQCSQFQYNQFQYNHSNPHQEHLTHSTVIAVDVPSGLNADTGVIAGSAIQADYTVTFIGLKTGLFTGSGRACCGQILFDDLEVPAEVYAQCPVDAHLLNQLRAPLLPPRSADAHKGQFGHVLIVGGNISMAGAAILAAKAALRSGAGLVTVFTHAVNVTAVTLACPEAMVVGSADGCIPQPLMSRVSHIAIGPGLAQDDWAKTCWSQCLQSNKPLVIDADALNLLAGTEIKITVDCVLTPHPGEAARLLGTDTRSIGLERYASVKKLYKKYASNGSMAVVLKGSGSLVCNGSQLTVCARGNPAMATAGMGDVLTGIVVALMAQKMSPMEAAECAVTAHGYAGDKVAEHLSRGMLASDVIEKLPLFL